MQDIDRVALVGQLELKEPMRSNFIILDEQSLKKLHSLVVSYRECTFRVASDYSIAGSLIAFILQIIALACGRLTPRQVVCHNDHPASSMQLAPSSTPDNIRKLPTHQAGSSQVRTANYTALEALQVVVAILAELS